jgi:hypothetical protein
VTAGRDALTPARRRLAPVLATALLLLAGCKAAPRLVGLASGVAAGAATANPAVGFAVGVTTDAATRAGVQFFGRSRQRAEQDAIAAAAANLGVGDRTTWRIEHYVPVGNEHGELEVVRLIDNPLAPCKEIAFSVAAGDGPAAPRSWYTTTLCRQDETWKWAEAEPAVERWGYLQ